MKGISHFISGVAAASCFPWAVESAHDGNPFYFVLGAVFGLLPDTIDFKFYRFFYRNDRIITPDPREPDPQAIADRIAGALAAAQQAGGLYRVKINTLRLAADEWQQFRIDFDRERQAVEVELGPVVTTGQVPVPGTIPAEPSLGRARLAAPIVETYEAVTTVDILDGPVFGFEKDAEGRMLIHFLPWHRSWTHSLVLGGAFATAVMLPAGWRAGLVVLAAYTLHILEDQLGCMGSSLFAPFSRRRVRGLGWMRSGDALPNFCTVWFCGLLIFWNCCRAHPAPLGHVGFFRLMFCGGVLPLGIYGLLHVLLTRKTRRREPADTPRQRGRDAG
jgi:membrane-bound metal-dependent hydrolase YbcI (DUF457 family)